MSPALVVLLVMTGFFLLVPLLSYLSTRRLVGKKLELDNQPAGHRLFYFYSPSCGPCRSMTPIVDQLASHSDFVTKVDINQDPELAGRFGIRATPTTVLVVNDTIKEVRLGAQSKKQLEKLLDMTN
ncbi:MAG: thioredoxin family protein [Chromatiales bacterium]|jgi:thioredoxin 1